MATNNQDSFQELTDEIRDITAQLRSNTHDIYDRQKKSLSKTDEKFLEYFWNNRRKEIRSSLPESIISFWENESLNEKMLQTTQLRVRLSMLHLIQKGYVSEAGDDRNRLYFLTKDGHVYLHHKHPVWINSIDRIFERTPNILKFLIGFVGLIASVFGIIQFTFEFILK